MKKTALMLPPALLAAAASCSQAPQRPQRPNILLIVADDLGMGDLGVYGSTAIRTPNIDSLASSGVCFERAYATSATSTPSRYAMFTGMYPWRNPEAKILPGDAPLIIAPDQPTFPKMLQDAGYETAAIGKWHLGMGDGNVDWNRQISPSANSVGFDYTCLIAATNDRVPTVYVKNGLVEGLDPEDPIYVDYENNFEGEPTAITNPEMLKMTWHHGHNCSIVNGIPRIGYMKGGQSARWVDEDMADYFVGEVKSFLERQSPDKPFFLYYGLHEPHVPRAPHQRFVGSTEIGPRGDAIVEADWCVGEVMAYLEEKGLLENTLIVFTSDNGPVVQDGYNDLSDVLLGDHDPRAGTRGGKYSLYDGGTHVPMIVSWKGVVEPGISDLMYSQLDFYASFAKLAGASVPDGLDSREHLDVLLGGQEPGRRSSVLEAKSKLAFIRDNYAIIPPYSGKERNSTGNELGNLKNWGLFDLAADRGQEVNIAAECPELLDELRLEFKEAAGAYYPVTE